MDTGAIGRSHAPSKTEPGYTAQQAQPAAGSQSVHQNGGKTVLSVASDDRGPKLGGPRSGQDRSDPAARAQTSIDRRTVIDPETETLLFQMIEKSTGEVKRQIPDDVLLNVREYARETALARSEGKLEPERTAKD